MKYIYQILIIFSISFAGELLNYFIPLPIPASIYGLIIMLALLCSGILKEEHIFETSGFLIKIMPLMFIPGGVGVIAVWQELKRILVPASVITAVSLVLTMGVTAKATELIMKIRKGSGKINE